MLRFLHTADLHLDRPFKGLMNVPGPILDRIKDSTFNTLAKIINIAIQEQVDFVIIAGDIYDGDMRSLYAQSRLRDQLNRLREHKIPVYIIHGNHDHLSGYWARLEWDDHIHFFGSDVEMKVFIKNDQPMAHLYGFSYAKRQIVANMTPHYQKQSGAPYHIGLLHGFFQEGSGHDVYAPFTLEDLLNKDFDYWALGHIHKRQALSERPPIWYPGTPQGLSIKETGEKGCSLVECINQSTSVTFISTSDVLWREEQITIENILTIDDLMNRIEQIKDDVRDDDQGVLLRLTLTGYGDIHSELSDESTKEDILHLIRDSEESLYNFVWTIEIKQDTTPPWERQQLIEDNYFIRDLLKLIDRTDDVNQLVTPLYTHRRAKHYLDQLSMEEQKEILNEAEILLIKSLLFDEEGEGFED